jgi:hypothetical protein
LDGDVIYAGTILALIVVKRKIPRVDEIDFFSEVTHEQAGKRDEST